MDNNFLTLGQASDKYGISVYTIRRICDRGLVRGIKRKRNGYRVLNNEQIEKIIALAKLLDCGMDWHDLKTFTRLEQAGNETIDERKAILATKKRQLWQKLEDIQSNIDFIERKEEILDALKNSV